MKKICKKCIHRISGCKSKPTLESRTCKKIIESLISLTFSIFRCGIDKFNICDDLDYPDDILESEYNDKSLETKAYNDLESEKDK